MLGYQDPSLLIGKNMHRLIHHSYADGSPMPIERCRVNAALREGMPVHADDEVFWRADGSSFPVEYWSYPQVARNAVAGAVVTFLDISERRKAEETIRHMATHDGLTDLPSLRLYRDRLEMAMGSARRNKAQAAVMFLDLDGFKAVNDGFGHDAGDEVLKEVAARLRSALRETDTVARAGGDEFVLVLTDLQSPEGAAQIAGKILQLIAQPIRHKGSLVTVGASIGISVFPRDADEADELIKLADEAMYSVKKAGKNSYSFAGEAGESRA
jgi:diguanylate cyclase (GGDEF)-like protein